MITQEEIKSCWRPEDVITLIVQKRQQLKEKISATCPRSSYGIKQADVNYILTLVDDVMCVEGSQK